MALTKQTNVVKIRPLSVKNGRQVGVQIFQDRTPAGDGRRSLRIAIPCRLPHSVSIACEATL
jgi:hypothetical protein